MKTPCCGGKIRLEALQRAQAASGRNILSRRNLPIVPSATPLQNVPAEGGAPPTGNGFGTESPEPPPELPWYDVVCPELAALPEDAELIYPLPYPWNPYSFDCEFGSCPCWYLEYIQLQSINSSSPYRARFFKRNPSAIQLNGEFQDEAGNWIVFVNCSFSIGDCRPPDSGCGCAGCEECMADCQDLINALNTLTATVEIMSLRLECLSQFVKQSGVERDYTARHYQYQEIAILRGAELVSQAIIAAGQAVAEEQIPQFATNPRVVSDTDTNYPLECELNPQP